MHPRLSLRAASVELLMIYLAANIAPPLTAVTISNIAYGGFNIFLAGCLGFMGVGEGGFGLYGNVSMDII